jgi:PAS domain S-box-containing protein
MQLSVTPDQQRDAEKLLEQIAAFAGPSIATGGASAPTDNPTSGDASERPSAWQPDLRYRSLVEKLPAVTFMANLDQRKQELYVSPQIEALLGFTQEEWMDNPLLWFEQLHPDDRENWTREFAQTCATGAHFRAEYRLLTRDGRVVWVQGECQIVRDEQGRPLFLQGIAFDITHLKRAAQIEEAKLTAEAASRAKSEFLARMSHEIRTPLNGVVGMIDLLRATELTPSQQRYARLARESADNLMQVINDILDFSKIEAGKVDIEAIPFDFHKVVEDLTELLAPMAARKSLALASFIRPEVPRNILGDPGRIRQVLTNLVNNALKFTSEGSVSIRAALESDGAGQPFIRAKVQDTGIGIPADRLDRLFKSFSQVDTSTTRQYGGTGLGLAISKQLVELMGGQIGIESTVGKGTTFWFTIKLVPAPGGDAAGPAEALRAIKLLAVEDDPIQRAILSEQLEGLLAPTSKVVTSKEALDALRQANRDGHPFSVAVMSCRCPLVRAIRADAALGMPQLLAIVGADEGMDAEAIRRAGFVGQLVMPLNQSRLLDAVASAMVDPVPAAQPAAVEAGDGLESLRGLHLLVAEDNEMNQFVTQETLRRAGCTCEIVADGAQAVAAASRGKFDLILMDCQMPVLDGLAATARIRQHESAAGNGRRIPIIALTAEALQGDRERCLAAGMDGYVTKPIDAADLFTAMRALVKNPTVVPAQS